jgi:peroxiredoxin
LCARPNKTAVVNAQKLAQLAFVAVASVSVYAFVAVAKEGEVRRSCSPVCALHPNYAAYERKAPDFELPNLKGEKVRLADFRGKTVVLNFWSKTCPPCLEEMPSVAALGHALRGRSDVVLLTVTTDESAEDATNTLRSILADDVPFEVLLDPEAKVVGDMFGTKLYPETWIIDPRGAIRARVDGARDWSAKPVLDYLVSLDAPLSCPIVFHKGKPSGSYAGLCEDMGQR